MELCLYFFNFLILDNWCLLQNHFTVNITTTIYHNSSADTYHFACHSSPVPHMILTSVLLCHWQAGFLKNGCSRTIVARPSPPLRKKSPLGMLEEFAVGTGLEDTFSTPEPFSMAHDYGRKRNRGEFGTRESGRGYSWSLLQTKICKGKFNYSTSGLNRSSKDTNNQTTYSITDPAIRKYKTLAISDPNG